MITLPRAAGLLMGAALGLAALSPPAAARVFVGLGFGVPLAPFYAPPVYAPPVYAPPPVYYPPPAAYYAPPPVAYAPPPVSYAPRPGGICYAGVYTCAADQPPGSQCSCPGIGARSYGVVR